MDSPNQEFDLEIKDKKGVENSVADHLSRMPITSTQDPLINDFLRDDMLLKVTVPHPWYPNIVNFMVSGYVPPEKSKKKLTYESRRHLWDAPYLYRVCADGLFRRCVLLTVINDQFRPSTPAQKGTKMWNKY